MEGLIDDMGPAHFQMLPQLSSKFPCTSQPLSNFKIQDFRQKNVLFTQLHPLRMVGMKTFFTKLLLTLVKSFADLIFTQHFAYKSEPF